ncbi:hypothetical protein ABIC83_003013 [Roseateles asaccharophilus]|uniref:hypothetical protein n=1 Tax=Roseateles asaccharophilus TaxID=582607 RepID=UPI00383508C5
MTKQSPLARRTTAADLVLEEVELARYRVDEHDGWEATSPGAELSKTLYVVPYIQGPGLVDSERARLVVRFATDDSTEVVGASVYMNSQEIWSLKDCKVVNAIAKATSPAEPATEWDQNRAKTILEDAKARYGAGWDLMSADQQQNYLDAQTLRLILNQGDDKYAAAQELADRMRKAIADTTQQASATRPSAKP